MSEYPAWRYHRTLPAKIVQTAKEDAALGPDWADTPAAFNIPEPDPPRDVSPPTARREWPIRRHRAKE